MNYIIDTIVLVFAILSTIFLVYMLFFFPDKEQEQYYADLEKQIKDEVNAVISLKNQEFRNFLDKTAHDMPLIHSTEHNTTIYAHKADA